MLKKAVFLIGLLLVGLSEAAIYQHTDANGNVIYSDEPMNENSQPLDLMDTAPSSVSTTPQKPAPSAAVQKPVQETPISYSVFSIVSPHNEETFQNPVAIPVIISLEPRLQAGDRIQMYVDGKAWHAAVVSTNFSLYEVERGAHQIQAKIIDKTDTVRYQSNAVTIFVQRASVLNKKPNS